MRKSNLAALAAAIVMATLAPRMAAAADCTVNLATDSDTPLAGELRDCIDSVAINAGDVVTINPGLTIKVTNGVINVNRSIKIVGAGPDSSVIDGSDNGGARVFNVGPEDSVFAALSGLKMLNGESADFGGAVHVFNGSSLNVTNAAFEGNHAEGAEGGAIFNNGELQVESSSFKANEALGNGGAIFQFGDSLVVLDSTFEGNFTTADQGGDGGAIFISNGSARIQNSNFVQNTADDNGGAVFHSSGDSLVIASSTIDGNHSTNRGGGLYDSSGLLVLQDSDLINNESEAGGAGGLQVDDEALVESCVIGGNKAHNDDGGAIHNDGIFTLRNSLVTGNSVTNARGGGLYEDSSGSFVENVTFTENQSELDGGGIFVNGSPVFLYNVTIAGNHSDEDGGGVAVSNITTLNNVTIADNSAGGDGGGLWVETDSQISNSIIAGNSDGGAGPDCFTTGGSLVSVGPNLVQNGTGCAFDGQAPIAGDPLLAELADNGGPPLGRNGTGPTLTLALGVGSPAIDAGDDDTCLAADQRGTARPQASACDLGAFEAGPSADLSSASLTFGEQELGTTSAAQTVTLSNGGGVPLAIASIAASGDFTQSNDCGGEVAAGGSCNIQVTFTPTATGVREGELTVETAANTQTVALLGSGFEGDGGDGGDGGCSLGGSNHAYPLGASLLGLSTLALAMARRRRPE